MWFERGWLVGLVLAAGLGFGGVVPMSAGASGALGRVSGAATATGRGVEINVVHCPSPGLCVAVDSMGNVLTSSGADASEWRAFRIGQYSLIGLSCPSTHLCVAISQRDALFASRNPAGGAGTWHRVYRDLSKVPYGEVRALACPSVRLCLAADEYGRIISSTNPASPGTWRARIVAQDLYHGTGGFAQLTCPTTHFCAALDLANKVWTTSDPRGGHRAWHSRNFPITGGNNNTLLSISCPTSRFCVLLDWFTRVRPNAVVALVSRTPEFGHWRPGGRLPVDGGPGVGLFCRSVSLCIAFGQSADPYHPEYFVASTSKPGSTRTWGVTTVPHQVDNVACPAHDDCVLVTYDGFRGYSHQPLGSDWSFAQVDTAPSSG
jgi:hypothetical protein